MSANLPLEPERERALLAAAAADDQAFTQLYDAWLPRVYAYAGYRVPAEDVEDVVAETFLTMARGLGRFRWRGPGSFAAWLFRIAHNQVADYYRRRGRSAAEAALGDDLSDPGPPPDQAAAAGERAARVRRLVAALPPRQQEAVLLRFFGGLANREIAAVLGVDERTVASNLARALDRLEREWREAMAGETYDER